MLFTIGLLIVIPMPASYLMIHLAIERHSNWFNAVLWFHYERSQSIAEDN